MIEILLIEKLHSVHKACTLEHQKVTTSWEEDREEIKSTTFELEGKPQALDQSKRVKAKQSRSWLSEQCKLLDIYIY